MRRFLLAFALSFGAVDADAVPFWGARASSPVDTLPDDLAPGDWIWGGDNRALGPMAVVVSLDEQRAYAYRNGMLIGVSTVSSGKPGHRTPTGIFTILQKDKDHHSDKYNNAPMPYQQRLTWDGVALHAGGLPGYPESHGCVHLPSAFAALLFDATTMGMTVVVSDVATSPPALVHPGMVSPIEPHTGAEAQPPPLADGEPFRWQPELAPQGALSIVVSRSDARILVYRGGVEIGRARVVVRADPPVTGTHAYVVADGTTADPDLPGLAMPRWIALGIPGRADEAKRELDAQTVGRIVVPRDFAALVLPQLKPGDVLVATDAPVVANAPLRGQRVLDAEPPEVANRADANR